MLLPVNQELQAKQKSAKSDSEPSPIEERRIHARFKEVGSAVVRTSRLGVRLVLKMNYTSNSNDTFALCLFNLNFSSITNRPMNGHVRVNVNNIILYNFWKKNLNLSHIQ
jgi:hypothetical protein